VKRNVFNCLSKEGREVAVVTHHISVGDNIQKHSEKCDTWSYQWNVKCIPEAQTRCNRSNGIDTRENGGKQQHLADVRINRHLRQVVSQRSQLFSVSVQRILATAHYDRYMLLLSRSDWLFHKESCPCIDVVHPGRAWSSSPACTWRCSLHYHLALLPQKNRPKHNLLRIPGVLFAKVRTPISVRKFLRTLVFMCVTLFTKLSYVWKIVNSCVNICTVWAVVRQKILINIANPWGYLAVWLYNHSRNFFTVAFVKCK